MYTWLFRCWSPCRHMMKYDDIALQLLFRYLTTSIFFFVRLPLFECNIVFVNNYIWSAYIVVYSTVLWKISHKEREYEILETYCVISALVSFHNALRKENIYKLDQNKRISISDNCYIGLDDHKITDEISENYLTLSIFNWHSI